MFINGDCNLLLTLVMMGRFVQDKQLVYAVTDFHMLLFEMPTLANTPVMSNNDEQCTSQLLLIKY